METIHAFIAIPLPHPLLEKLAALQRKLEKQIPSRSVRWVRVEGIHLTLKFLGDTPMEKSPDIEQALGIPMVHGSVADFLGQVMTIFPGDAGLHSLYGEGSELPKQGLEAQLGCPAATPMAVAAWEAQEVVKILTDQGELLRRRLLVMDMESGVIEILQLG
jgi:hypothetical protein